MGWIGRKKQRTGVKKTIYLDKLWNHTVIDYAQRTGLSQSDVIERLMLLGDKEFRKRFGLEGKSAESEEEKEKAKDREDAVRLQREKRERDWQEAREERMRKIVTNYENVDEEYWTRRE